MPFNGNGVFNRLYSWVNDAANGIRIRADRMDNDTNDIAAGLSNCVTRDGQSTILADIPMGGYKFTDVGNAVNGNEFATLSQVQKGDYNWAVAGGTADALTVTNAVPVLAYEDAMLQYVRATAANATTTPTIAVDGLPAVTVVKNGNQALIAGDIAGAGHELILRYNSISNKFELMNPKVLSPILASNVTYNNATSGLTATNTQAAIDELAGDISGLGTAASKNVGTAIGNVVELINKGGNAALPAVDGSNLTGLSLGLGYGQTWQNVTGSRAADTNYTNSTGKPILIAVSCYQGSGTAGQWLVGGVKIIDKGNGGVQATDTFIVPDGATYRYTKGSGTFVIGYWAELR